MNSDDYESEEHVRYEQICNAIMLIKEPQLLLEIRSLCYDRYKVLSR